MKATPFPMTQQDVDAMISGGKAASAIRRRLAMRPPAESAQPLRQLSKAEKPAPQPISKEDMAAIRAARVPASIRKRISSPSPEPAAASMSDALGPKPAPTEAPPKRN